MVTKFPPISFLTMFVPSVFFGKHPQDRFDKGKYWRASKGLQLVHRDIAGPFPTLSFQSARYFLTFIDD
jgi:hypothetical protein